MFIQAILKTLKFILARFEIFSKSKTQVQSRYGSSTERLQIHNLRSVFAICNIRIYERQ